MPRKGKTSRLILIALSLLLLLPLSMDTVFRWEWFGYRMRLTYLAFGALLVYAGQEYLRSESWRKLVREKYFHQPTFWIWLLLIPVGLTGAISSSYPQRTLVFTAWTTATILGTPLIALLLVSRFGILAYRGLGLYAFFQSLVVISDSITCFLPGNPTLGNVVIYVDHQGCRPHAFYKEPNYFAAFFLLLYPSLRGAMAAERNPTWRIFLGVSSLAIIASILLSTSKTGILGLIWVLGVELIFFLKRLATRNARAKPAAGVSRKKLLLPLLCGALLGVGILAAVFKNGYLQQGIWETINFQTRNGTNDRRINALLYKEIVPHQPWFGVGPGGTGAWLVARWDQVTNEIMPITAYYFDHIEPSKKNLTYLRSDPLFWNAFSEVLVEWGILGAGVFAIALSLLLLQSRGLSLALMGGSLLAVCCTWQTIARLDLWVCLSFYAAGGLLGRRSREDSAVV